MIKEFKSLSFIAKSFLVVFFIVLFEGAFRKWLNIPSIPLMFLRDLIVLSSLLYGLKYFDFRAFPEFTLTIWTFIVIIWSLIQTISELMPIPVTIIGIRSWLLYFWFALLCSRVFNKNDLYFILKVLLYTLIPIVILVIIQHLSPVSSFINRQAEGNEKDIFTVTAGIVRPTATFTFTLGYTTYLTMIGPLVIWLLTEGTNFIKNYYFRILIIGSYFLGVLVSGSRGAILLCVVLVSVWIFTIIMTKKFKISTKSILLIPFILGISLYLLAPIMERALNANISRIEVASKAEDLPTRILHTFIGSNETWNKFEILGYGVGAGSNAAKKFISSNNEFLLGENEIDRILNEGGIIGIFFEIIKILISLSALIVSAKLLLKKRYTLPILFWSLLTIQLLTATTTGQITVNAFTFLSLGLGWSILNIYKKGNLI